MQGLHPDARQGKTNHTELAAVAAAWDVLSHNERRARYDRELLANASSSTRNGADYSSVSFENAGYNPLKRMESMPRFPWRGVLILIAAGSILILVLSAFTDQSGPSAPDNLLQSGSCVNFEPSGAAFEVTCDGNHEAEVANFIAFDATCPLGTDPHRDRQGMGLACTVPRK